MKFNSIQHQQGLTLNNMTIFSVILGLLIGSFLNVCIYRIPRNESIAFPPSHCPHCEYNLKPADLVPVLSYLCLRGRCRKCKAPISLTYPVVEALNALLYGYIVYTQGPTISAVLNCVLVSLFIVIAKIDYETLLIPNRLNIAIAVIGTVSLVLSGVSLQGMDRLFGLLLGGGFFFLLSFIAMGGGDVKLMAALGWTFGLAAAIQITVLSFLFGAVISCFLLLLKIKGRKDAIPFGPFIVLAGTVYVLWGNRVLDWYLGLL